MFSCFISLSITGKARYFWGKSDFKPTWWPNGISFDKRSKLLNRKSSMLILQAYREFIFREDQEQVQAENYRDRSPRQSPAPERKNSPIEATLQDEDVSTSSDLTPFPNDTVQLQPETTYELENIIPLAKLSGAIPLSPLKVETRILDESTRTKCLKELDNPRTFLSDITMNAFSVSKGKKYFLFIVIV